jgi:hypothetical protein
MKATTRIQLVRQLEAVKEFERVNNPSRYAQIWWWGEAIAGAFIIAGTVLREFALAPWWASVLMFFVGLTLLVQGVSLVFRHHLDTRYRLLLEAILSIPDQVEAPEPTAKAPKKRSTRLRRK